MQINDTTRWLLDSDPSIRWQVMKDIQNENESTYRKEQLKLSKEGWCFSLLKLQGTNGLWNNSLYNGKWISTTYTLYLLKQLGLPSSHAQALSACEQLFSKGIYKRQDIRFTRNQEIQDLGVTALVLSLCCYFGYDHEYIHDIVKYLINKQEMTGNWLPNNSERSVDYTFDTTLLILEALLQYRVRYRSEKTELSQAEKRGQDFLLSHELYLANNKILNQQWMSFSFPPYWHYDILTALDYFCLVGTSTDNRLRSAINVVTKKRNSDGTWNLGKKHPGKTYIEMENPRKPSRWNTLRAMRVLKWWKENE